MVKQLKKGPVENRADKACQLQWDFVSPAKSMDENARLSKLYDFDRSLGQLIIGLDEAGRGPLAGPVVAAAVVSGTNLLLPGLDDSKKLSPAKREELYRKIVDSGAIYAVGFASNEEIDKINILEATKLAMLRALEKIDTNAFFLITDGVKLPNFTNQINPYKGESKSLSVAAASIIAKVTRDRIMVNADQEYPCYGFIRHKGYGTKEHLKSLEKHGPCRIHRQSFAPLSKKTDKKFITTFEEKDSFASKNKDNVIKNP